MLLYYYNCVLCNMGWSNSFRHVYYQESWAPKNWCFWTVVLEKILESPLDCKEIQPVHPKGNESWKIIGRTDAEAELQYFGHVMQRTDTFEKTLMLGKIEDGSRRGNRGWDGWMALLTRWTWVWVSSASWWWTGEPGVLQSMGSQRVRHDWETELNWLSSHVLSLCVCVCFSCSAMSDFFVIPWTVVHQGPLSVKFSRQKYWSVLPFPYPEFL